MVEDSLNEIGYVLYVNEHDHRITESKFDPKRIIQKLKEHPEIKPKAHYNLIRGNNEEGISFEEKNKILQNIRRVKQIITKKIIKVKLM